MKHKNSLTREQLLHYYGRLWELTSDGNPIYTHSSLLKPVLYKDSRAMLKIPLSTEEKRGNYLMIWWDGVGAAQVLEWDDNAILMERITREYSLEVMASDNQDDEATSIICRVANTLHSHMHSKKSFPELIPLDGWFKDLFTYPEKYSSLFTQSAAIASRLLRRKQEVVVLHGDLHHNNVLHSSERGWLAIDPKGLLGEKAFDYVNILCNPNRDVALSPKRLTTQIDIISNHTGISHHHLLEWTAAWAGLSATWFLNDNQNGSLPK